MIYIRHGEKKYSNRKSKTYPLDPELTEIGKKQVENKLIMLLDKYGIPEKILTSPFLRTRETASIAQLMILKEKKVFVPIVVEPQIGEYLGNQKNVCLLNEVRPDTYLYRPIASETLTKFSERVGTHVETTMSENDGMIWHVTHGLFIQKVCKFYNVKIKYPKECSGVYINDTEIDEF